MSSQQFADIARKMTKGLAPDDEIESALHRIGARAREPLDSLDHDRRAGMASQFIRNVRTLQVAEACRLERALLDAIGALPSGVRSFTVADAVSRVTLRNFVRYALVGVGAEWSLNMRVQSFVSELMWRLATAGGCHVEIDVRRDHVRFGIRAIGGGNVRDLSSEAAVDGVSDFRVDVRAGENVIVFETPPPADRRLERTG